MQRFPREHRKFQKAVSDYTVDPNSATAINTMINLALEGLTPTIRRWASQWLLKNCNIRVLDENDQSDGGQNAASATSKGIL